MFDFHDWCKKEELIKLDAQKTENWERAMKKKEGEAVKFVVSEEKLKKELCEKENEVKA